MFLQHLGQLLYKPSPVYQALNQHTKMPTPIYEDNKGCRDMLAAQRVTANLKHVEIPFQFIHGLHFTGSLTCLPCGTKLMFADTLTKQETGPKHAQGRNWYMGKRFYLPANSKHFVLLTSLAKLS